MNYTSVFNDIEQDEVRGIGMGKLKIDMYSYALSAGLRADYKLIMDAIDITPHVGVRYTYLHTDEYDVKANGSKVLKGDEINQSIWSFPFGVTFSKDIALDNGWYVKPLLDLNVTPRAGEIKANSEVRFTGVGQKAEVESQMLDYITYGGTAGLEFGSDNIKLGVNYNLQMGANSTSHGVNATFRFEF